MEYTKTVIKPIKATFAKDYKDANIEAKKGAPVYITAYNKPKTDSIMVGGLVIKSETQAVIIQDVANTPEQLKIKYSGNISQFIGQGAEMSVPVSALAISYADLPASYGGGADLFPPVTPITQFVPAGERQDDNKNMYLIAGIAAAVGLYFILK